MLILCCFLSQIGDLNNKKDLTIDTEFVLDENVNIRSFGCALRSLVSFKEGCVDVWRKLPINELIHNST